MKLTPVLEIVGTNQDSHKASRGGLLHPKNKIQLACYFMFPLYFGLLTSTRDCP